MTIFWVFIITEILYANSLINRVQMYLSLSGYDVGNIDGIVGSRTREGLSKAYENTRIDKNYHVSTKDIPKLRNVYLKKSLKTWSKRSHLNKKMTVADARHLLERTGIGAHYLEIEKFTQQTRAEAIRNILSNFDDFPQTPLPKFIYDDLPPYWIRWDFDEPGRQAFRVARDKEMSQFRDWWVQEMITTTKPQNERLMLFWTNHFPVEYSAISEQSISIARQHLMFRAFGFGNYKLLVKQIIKDPAMLNYLDGENSKKGAPNENLGRELMELFVLGEGAYDEKTVKEASRSLTGYRYNRLRDFEFELNDWAHDKKRKTLFGQKGNFDGDDLVDILFQQPEAATFLTKKFWKYYISEAYEDRNEIERIALEFKKSNFEIPILLSEILASESFWLSKHRGTIIKSPVDLVIGSIRSTGFLPSDWQNISGVLARLGQNLFEPPNVAGWSGGASWITPAALLNRSRFLYGFFKQEGINLVDVEKESPEITMARRDNIIIRYGAENYKGPPNFYIRLGDEYANKQVWVSPTIVAKGGHDTELFGRLKNDEIPWNLAAFDFDPSIDFKKVSVYFLNDNCCGPGGADGGDRNFFVDWVKVGEHLLLSQDGKQYSRCKNNKNPGFLYCEGSVVMDKANSINVLNTEAKDIKAKKDQLVIERVAFEWGKKRDVNNRMELDIGLLNVRFNSHFESGIKLRIIGIPNRYFKLVLKSDKCSKSCLSGDWPKSTFRRDNGKTNALEFSVGPNEKSDQRRQFQQLSKEDKKFVSALWAAVPTLLNKMQEGRNFNNRNGKEVLLNSDEFLKEMYKNFKKSRYHKNYDFPPLLINTNPNKKSEGMMSMAMSSISFEAPIPASKNFNKTDQEWSRALISAVGSQNISAAVLATNSVAVQTEQVSTKELLHNPVFQLK